MARRADAAFPKWILAARHTVQFGTGAPSRHFLPRLPPFGGRGAFQRIRGCIQTCGAAGEAPLTIMRDASIKWAFPVKLTRELEHAGGDQVIKFYGGGIALR